MLRTNPKKGRENAPMVFELGKEQKPAKGCCKEEGKKRDGDYQLNMLAQKNRLKKKKDFDKAFKKGKGFKENFLFIRVVKNDLEATRFGFVVSKAFSKKATSRNKIKRRLRELIKEKETEIKKGFDVVLVVMKGLEKQDVLETEKTVNSLFKKAKLL